MADTVRLISPVKINGKTVNLDLTKNDVDAIKDKKGISNLVKIVGDTAVTFYVDTNLKLRGNDLGKIAGFDTTAPGSFAMFCNSIESKINDQKCNEISMPILRTVCKKDEIKNCDRLSKSQLVSTICKKQEV